MKLKKIIPASIVGALCITVYATSFAGPMPRHNEPGHHRNDISTSRNYNEVDHLARLGGMPFKGHLYKVFDKTMNWLEARNYCRVNGGHLVIIKDEEEQEFVLDLVTKKGKRNCYWIGAGKDGDTLRWIDESEIEYANWGEGQPDNYLGNEYAVMMYRLSNPMGHTSKPGDWNDARYDGECNNEPFFGAKNIGFICEWDN